MQDIARSETIAVGDSSPGRAPFFGALAIRFRALVVAAVEREIALRRPFLWTPVAGGAGALLYFSADHEPSLPFALALFAGFSLGAWRARETTRFFVPLVLLACVSGGFFSACWRAARVDAPILPRLGIGVLTGFVEEVDPRRAGARFVLRIASAEG
ncbi:MAG: competence protein ComEC, partial [Methylocystis sp.]